MSECESSSSFLLQKKLTNADWLLVTCATATVRKCSNNVGQTGLAHKKTAFRTFWGVEADLSCRGDGASGHPDGVDATVGVLVDFDVGPLLPGLDVSHRVKQVQHLLVVQLESALNK